MSGDSPIETVELLQAWHRGDAGALAALVQRELPWIARRVRSRLGSLLRTRHDTQDIVQEALLGALRDGPRFVVSDRDHLRGLLARLVENVIRREHEHLSAIRRDARRDAPLPSRDTVLYLQGAPSPAPPDAAAAANELRAWVRLALELLGAEDREIVMLREYRGLAFATIGAELGLKENTARMRFTRALARLGVVLDQLRGGRLGELLHDSRGARWTGLPS